MNKNGKRYEDLLESNIIKYYRQSNDDMSVLLVDNKNNVVNEFNLWSNTQTTKEVGEKLGTRIYETATEKTQTIELNNDKNIEPDYFMSHRSTESGITADNKVYKSWKQTIVFYIKNEINSRIEKCIRNIKKNL